MGTRAMVSEAMVASRRRVRKGEIVRWIAIVDEDIVGCNVLVSRE